MGIGCLAGTLNPLELRTLGCTTCLALFSFKTGDRHESPVLRSFGRVGRLVDRLLPRQFCLGTEHVLLDIGGGTWSGSPTGPGAAPNWSTTASGSGTVWRRAGTHGTRAVFNSPGSGTTTIFIPDKRKQWPHRRQHHLQRPRQLPISTSDTGSDGADATFPSSR